jgi:hypothetical protein
MIKKTFNHPGITIALVIFLGLSILGFSFTPDLTDYANCSSGECDCKCKGAVCECWAAGGTCQCFCVWGDGKFCDPEWAPLQ